MIIELPIKELILLEKNPRTISKEQLQKLCDSIEEDPDYLLERPVLVNEIDGKYHVYAGNQRIQAAKKLKRKTIPCSISKDVPEEIIKKRIIKDNKTYGEFDYDILANEYDIDILIEAGFTPEELIGDVQNIESTEEEENEVLEPPKDPITKSGDIYELNSHRLFCGDSTNPDHISKLIRNNTPILMVTDPPYGVSYDPTWRNDVKGAHKPIRAAGKVQNDNQVNWALAWHLFPGSVAYVWCASWYLPEVAKSIDEAEFERKSLIIWAKQHFALSRGDYHWQHEPCWYAIKKGHQHNWQGSRKESTLWEIANLNCFGKSQDEDERTAHSTQKPLECMAKPIRNNSAEGESVYDPFIGSGTTLIAAEQLNRICYGMEIDPAYCDIIVERYKNYMIKNNKEFTIKKNGEIINGN